MCRQGAGVEIYPGSVCRLVGNGIHHCKDGVLIKVTSAVDASPPGDCVYQSVFLTEEKRFSALSITIKPLVLVTVRKLVGSGHDSLQTPVVFRAGLC